MSASIWSGTLAEFRNKAGGTDPVPAGVSISAVTASLALALIAKVLGIRLLRTKSPETTLLDAVQLESTRLAQLADRDIRAFEHYMDCVRSKQPKDDAMREAIKIPMDAARSAIRGIELCHEATALFSTGLTAADLGGAASLLRGAAQAMLLSAEANLSYLPPGDPLRAETAAELATLRRFSSV